MFAQQKLEYLGHIVRADGVATDPSKVAAVTAWPVPKNLKELRGFLGLTGYYHKFIQSYGIISRPLTELLKKGLIFQWTPTADKAFQLLKKAMVSALVLAVPDFSKTFVLETDACKDGVGAVLMQQGHPLAYLSKAFCPKNQALSTYEKECLALLMVMEKWRPYLQHRRFMIRTDHQALRHLSEQRLSTGIQHKAFVKLMGLDYTIQYKKGVQNAAADSLSHRPQVEPLLAISAPVPAWLEQLVAGYADDPQATKLLTELAISPDNTQGFTLSQGVLRYKGRVWVGLNKLAQQHITQSMHDSAVGGHSGVLAMYQRIKCLFAWPKMKKTVTEYVQHCEVCQRAKVEHCRQPGLLQPHEIPPHPWHTLSWDFVEGLPRSQGMDVVLVVIDKLTKYGHFIPLKHPYTAQQVAQVFFDQVYHLHGMPFHIISDRDPIFTSLFWQELFRLSDTILNMSSARHPETDGQTEKLNQCMEAFLRCFAHDTPVKWARWLPLAEHWYNTSFHMATGRSPFEALYGYSPRPFGLEAPATNPDVVELASERESMLELLHQHLLRAQQRMKRQADKHRSERSFAVGDRVYLKVQPTCRTPWRQDATTSSLSNTTGPIQFYRRLGRSHIAWSCRHNPRSTTSSMSRS